MLAFVVLIASSNVDVSVLLPDAIAAAAAAAAAALILINPALHLNSSNVVHACIAIVQITHTNKSHSINIASYRIYIYYIVVDKLT